MLPAHVTARICKTTVEAALAHLATPAGMACWNLGLADCHETAEGIVTGGHDNTTARTVAIREGEAINAPALTAMLRQIVADNRAGGWRKLKREARAKEGR